MDSNVLSTKGFVLKILTKSIIVMLVLTGIWLWLVGLVSAEAAPGLWPCSDFNSLLIDCFPLINPRAIKGKVSSSRLSLPRSFSSQILKSYLANSISCYGCINLSKLSWFPCAFIHSWAILTKFAKILWGILSKLYMLSLGLELAIWSVRSLAIGIGW